MNNTTDTSGTSELQAVIGALLDTLDDKNQNVKQCVVESIQRISEQNPKVVVHTSVYFWELHRKISVEHVSSLLKVMTHTCKEYADQLNTDLASSVAELAVQELSGAANKEATELLVALSNVHCTQAMGGLLTKLEPGVIPQIPVIRTIGMIAASNPSGMLPFFKITLCIMLPMLSIIRDDTLKQTFCFTLGKYCEAINHYLMNLEEGVVPEINKETYKEEICDVFDIISYHWLRTTRDQKLAEAVLDALVDLIPLLTMESDSERIIKLIPILLSYCKRSNLRLPAVKVLAVLLNCSTNSDKETFRPYLEQIHQTLFDLISINPFEASREVLLAHYEALQCSRSLVILYPEEGLDRILQQLKSSVGAQRSRALIILRHLINTLPAEDDGALQRIALNLQDSLGDSNTRQMVGAIVALAARPTFPLLPSQRALFVRYMVSHCGHDKNDETEAYAEALHLLATTVEGAELWLWPCLIKSLLDPSCVGSAVAILRALTPLANKITRSEDSSSGLEKDFPSMKVLGRCLELLADPQNRPFVLAFLKSSALLFGHQLKPYWDTELAELSNFLLKRSASDAQSFPQWEQIWEERMVGFLEKSVNLEGESWSGKLAEELASKATVPHVAPLLASMCESLPHIALIVELARSHSNHEEYARAVGVCAKRHLSSVLKIVEESCLVEDHKKVPVKLLGLMKDVKAAASAEAAKAGLLKSYAEIARRADPEQMFPSIEKHILPWILRQLIDCKELSAKEAGLIALEQVSNAMHPDKLPESTQLHAKSTSLATLLNLLQSSAGYRPLQLYPLILRAMIALIRIPPVLTSEERAILIGTVLDKVIAASTEIVLQLQPDIMQQVINASGIVCSEVVSDSSDALAELVDILLPWMQSKSSTERKTALLILRITLRSYYNSLKYTYPGGRLEPGKLLGRILSWSADPEHALRPIVVDCVILSLKIGCRLRALSPDTNLDQQFNELKSTIINEDSKVIYDSIRNLASAVCEKIPNGEIISLAEGLIEGLLFRGEAGLAAGIALSEHFKIKGSEISRTDVYLLDNIISQMRQMENSSCRREAAHAVKSLMMHHVEEAIERLLSQPLPLDRGAEECWKEIGNSDDLGTNVLGLLLTRLENNNLLAENPNASHSSKNNTAYFPSLAAIIALKNILQSSKSEVLVEKHLAGLLGVLLKYLAGWLHVDAPMSIISTKFGYVPNREASKINPHAEVYLVLMDVLNIVDSSTAATMLNENAFHSETQAEESLISVVRTTIKCISTKQEVLSSLAQFLGKLISSSNAAQRAVAATFYSELIGKVDCGVIWLDAIINTLHDAKSDSSPLVRKLVTIGLARIAYLEPKQINEYFDNCMAALLDGLEEPANAEGGHEVVIESLRGLSVLLSVQCEHRISPRVVLALKPFIGKDNWEMRLAAISALGAVARNWQRLVTSPNDDVTDHLLGCLPCLTMRLEDSNITVVKTTQETLKNFSNLLQCPSLADVLRSHLGQEVEFHFENYVQDLIKCLEEQLPQRAEELRNAVVRGYSRSENARTRATSALILGLFGPPRPEDVQRLLQLLRDKESDVRIRAAEALAMSFTRQQCST